VADNGVKLPAKVALTVWKPGQGAKSIPNEVQRLAKNGHSVILANGNSNNWYLRVGYGWTNIVSLWPTVYALDPLDGTNLTHEEEKLVIGGEASLWSEEIDANNLDQKAWPRGSAFAERMWSPRSVKNADEAAPRLARQFCRMQARGVRPAPIATGSCMRQLASSVTII